LSEIPVFATRIEPLEASRSSQPLSPPLPMQRFLTTGPAQVYIFTTRCNEPKTIFSLQQSGAIVHTMGEERVDLHAVFAELHRHGMRSVLVEGGGTLIAELFNLGLVDELYVYIAPLVFGGATSPTLADGPGFLPGHFPQLLLMKVERMVDDDGVFIHYLVTKKD
jgi:2,5-diamino-6-(ribosylamino)-4(3H)-pyrimidinone 5'-phosphate reductase